MTIHNELKSKQNYYRFQYYIQYCHYSLTACMFPKIKSKSQKILQLQSVLDKSRTKQWNDRFIISSIPEYSSLNDPFIKKYRKSETNKNSQMQFQTIGNPLTRSISHRKSSLNQPPRFRQQQLYNKYLKVQNIQKQPGHKQLKYSYKIDVIITKLQQLLPQHTQDIIVFYKVLASHAIPEFYIYYTLKSYIRKIKYQSTSSTDNVNNQQFDMKGQMQKQIKQSKTKQSNYYKILLCYQTRQKFLQIFTKFIQQKIQNQQEILIHKQKLCQNVKTLRLMTLNLIQSIMKWRWYLGTEVLIEGTTLYLQPVQQRWMYNQQKALFYIQKVENKRRQNVLIKLLNDNKFIFDSCIPNCVRMGTKNDPFLLSPLIKAQSKQKSQYLQIFQLPPQIINKYKKTMQYLAIQKAYQMKIKTAVQKKSPKRNLTDVQKIYLNNNVSKHDNVGHSQNEKDNQDKLKISRVQRLKKNQSRINMIKAVYDKSEARGQGKGGKQQDDLLQQIGKKEINKAQNNKNRSQLDQQFDKLVQQRFKMINIDLNHHDLPQVSKQNSKPKQQEPLKSPEKTQTQQQKMISKVKNLNKQLKQKLQQISKQTDSTAPQSQYAGKSNKQVVQQLKKQIVEKIERQQSERLELKKRKKQQQQKIVQQIKEKLKKQMEQRLQKKKQQKLMEKQQLQKELKKQQQRIKEQKQLQISLLMKLNKQRQLRYIQKLKRQSIQKENSLKEQLTKQQILRREQEQLVQKAKLQKQKVIKQLQIRQLKQQLQAEVRQLYTQKNNKQVEKNMQIISMSPQKLTKSIIQQKSNQNAPEPPKKEQFTQQPLDKTSIIKGLSAINMAKTSQIRAQQPEISMEKLRLQKQIQLKKQLTLMKDREQREIKLIQRQNQLRQRMLKLKKDEQIIMDKDINGLMKNNILIQRQKLLNNQSTLPQNLTSQQQQKKLEVMQKMKKQEELQAKKQAQMQKIRKQRQIQQQILREKVRQKIEKQLRQQAVKRTKIQIEQRQQKEYDRRKQESQYKNKIYKQKPIDKSAIIDEQKSKILISQFLAKQVNEQNAKSSLRSKFQNQLFASSLPSQYYLDKQYFKIRNTQPYLGDDYIYNKLQKSNQDVIKIKQIQHSPFRKSDIKQHIFQLTDEQLYIYKKQKSKNIENMDRQRQPNNNENTKKDSKYLYEQKKREQGYQLMDIKQNSDQQKKYNVKVVKDKQGRIKKLHNTDSQHQQQIRESRKNKIFNTIPNQIKQKKIIQKRQNKNKKNTDQQQQQIYKKGKKQTKTKPNSETDELKRSKSISDVLKKKAVKPIKKNRQSDEDSQANQSPSIKKSKKNKKQQQSQQQGKKSYKAILDYPQAEKIPYKKQSQPQLSSKHRFSMQFEAIPETELDHQLQNHFSRLAPQQTDILPMDRSDLYKKLINQLTFSIITGSYQNRMAGMAYVHHDRYSTNSDTRKFVISHIGTYSNKDLKQFIAAICDFILLKDPCDQIQFYYHFNQNQQKQLQFSNQLTKWFNELGTIFQKKLDQQIYQRKFVYKRQYKHKCQIDLTGINKNVFRNIVSINAGMLISSLPLQQNKQHFRNIKKSQDQQSNIIQNRLIYLLMVSQLFRQYMTPQQAQTLKQKLKSSQKCKELLSMIITLQKKKLKIEQYKLSEYKNIIELNMKLMSHGKQIIKYVQDVTGVTNNELFYAELAFRSQLMFNFQVAALPVTDYTSEVDHRGKSLHTIRHVSYFRLNAFSNYKLHLVKSSLYNSQMYIFATDNPKLKVFIINAQQYFEIKTKQRRQTQNTAYYLTLSNYIQIFMKNISKYDRDSQYKHIWIPQIGTDKQASQIKSYKQFYSREIYFQQNVSMSYKQFIPSGLIIQPEHRDLVIGVPFVIGVMSMNVEQVLEGAPLYARIIDKNDVKVIEIQK